jgi:murein L,D-transpeptidase YcbB/YkuD
VFPIQAAAFVLAAAIGELSAQPAPTVQAALEHPSADAAKAHLETHLPIVTAFYAARGHAPVWTAGDAFNDAGRSVLAAIRRSDLDGLTPGDYLAGPLESAPAPGGGADADVLLSLTVIRFAHDLATGVLEPVDVDTATSYQPRPFDPVIVLTRVAGAPDPGRELLAVAPTGPAYDALKAALARLRKIRGEGGWHTASAGPTLRRGDRGPLVQELRTLLVERGDLDPAARDGDLFDDATADALARFQRRHGLEPDGVLGPMVRSALNVPLAARIQQVRLGLERLRWLPSTFTGRRIGVNLAAFRVYLLDDDAVTWQTPAVIGREYHATPMFSAPMTYVVINPYWNVPASIARREILPKVKEDPGYLARNNMEIVDGMVRQRPGPSNSLGAFKFMFPNPHSVYLHDTPARTLFERADRAFSHGCIRIQDPGRLAELLLGGQGWPADRIAAALRTGRQTVVTLQAPVPVHITYATAFLDPGDELLHYRRDVYGRDARLVAALARAGRGAWDR